jgi:hypothetical protein
MGKAVGRPPLYLYVIGPVAYQHQNAPPMARIKQARSISGQANVINSGAGNLPFRCSGRALRDEIGGILDRGFVSIALPLLTARR